MPYPDWWEQAEPDIHASIGAFAEWMENKLAGIKPYNLIVKNPFLFRARAPQTANQLATRLIDAFMSSSEETHFGDILEAAAIAICREAKGGWKSTASGIDLEYEDENEIRTIMQIKSGTKWGNASQRKKLVSDFNTAARVLRQGGIQVRMVEGICYGPSGLDVLKTHIKLVGNTFWEDISGWEHTGRAVFHIVEQHAANGLTAAKTQAILAVVNYLIRAEATTNGNVNWHRLYDLIMMPTRQRPH